MSFRRRSTIKGAASFRRLLRRLPDSARGKLGDVLERAGPVLADKMRSRLPSRTGKLRAAIDSKFSRKTLNLKVGLLNAAKKSDFFYGHILDVGRKAQTVTVTRKKNAKPYKMNVRAIAALRVERQGLIDFRQDFLPDFGKLTTAILTDAAKGAGDD